MSKINSTLFFVVFLLSGLFVSASPATATVCKLAVPHGYVALAENESLILASSCGPIQALIGAGVSVSTQQKKEAALKRLFHINGTPLLPSEYNSAPDTQYILKDEKASTDSGITAAVSNGPGTTSQASASTAHISQTSTTQSTTQTALNQLSVVPTTAMALIDACIGNSGNLTKIHNCKLKYEYQASEEAKAEASKARFAFANYLDWQDTIAIIRDPNTYIHEKPPLLTAFTKWLLFSGLAIILSILSFLLPFVLLDPQPSNPENKLLMRELIREMVMQAKAQRQMVNERLAYTNRSPGHISDLTAPLITR